MYKRTCCRTFYRSRRHSPVKCDAGEVVDGARHRHGSDVRHEAAPVVGEGVAVHEHVRDDAREEYGGHLRAQERKVEEKVGVA